MHSLCACVLFDHGVRERLTYCSGACAIAIAGHCLAVVLLIQHAQGMMPLLAGSIDMVVCMV